MNLNAPVKEFGRYAFAVTEVVAVRRLTGTLRRLLDRLQGPRYEVSLTNGQRYRFTEAEKALLDAERTHHQNVVAVHGLIQEMKRMNRPAAAA